MKPLVLRHAFVILDRYEYSKTNRRSRNYRPSFVSRSVGCVHGIIIDNVLPPYPYPHVKERQMTRNDRPVRRSKFKTCGVRRQLATSGWMDGCPAQEMETSLITVIPISRTVIGRHHERRIRITTCAGQLTY